MVPTRTPTANGGHDAHDGHDEHDEEQDKHQQFLVFIVPHRACSSCTPTGSVLRVLRIRLRHYYAIIVRSR